MAKATAVCTCAKCGATFEVSAVKSNRREADNWKAWAESHYDECPDCYKARKQQEREAANVAAAEKARGAGLPDLSGSEKQIAWATKIRQDFVDDRFPVDKLTDDGRKCLIDFLGQHTDSRFWIDRRSDYLGLWNMVIDVWRDKYSNGKRYNSSAVYQYKTENTASAVPSAENIS